MPTPQTDPASETGSDAAVLGLDLTIVLVKEAADDTRNVLGLLKRYWRAFWEWRQRQSSRTALHDLSDRELKDIGVRLAIDDFGTGYSSLSYLRDLPIDVLKMDKSFVDGIGVSERRLALAEAIVKLARQLGLEIIAEGIESETQRDLLIPMGCELGQGYLLAMPMPAPSICQP